MPTLLTGASGFVGGHVARAIARRGDHLRLLVRNTSKLDHLDGIRYDRCVGDLRDRASLERAVRGCELVFHVAADYRLWAPDPRELYASNVEGTANLLDAAAAAGVTRIVYTSTVGTIHPPAPGEVSDEGPAVGLAQMAGDYKRSKLLAERAALERARRGLPIVVVNPTAPVGEADVKPTPTGKIVLDFLLGRMLAFIDTGLNVVDVRAVAEGHLLAGERGRIGERYILGGENMTLRQILEALADITGRPAPRLQIPYALAYVAAIFDTGFARLTGRPPTAPIEAVKMARYKMWVRSDKAVRELGYQPGSAREALCRAVDWFVTHGYAPRSAVRRA